MAAVETEPATGEGADESIEQRADKPQQMPLPGTRPALSLNAGGEAPESSSVKMRGGSVPIEGEYDKGDLVSVWVQMRVSEVHFVDKVDQHGNVTGTERRHLARMERVQRA